VSGREDEERKEAETPAVQIMTRRRKELLLLMFVKDEKRNNLFGFGC
jgi:hypothetical protein